MSVESHVQELRRKHQSLSNAIEAAARSPGVDDLSISQMKKEKLRLKEEITRLLRIGMVWCLETSFS